MTAMCVALDPKTGRASVVGAGHPPLLVSRHDGKTELINSCAPPLGLAERKQFVRTIVDLAPGDAFLLYTDGLYGGSDREKRRLTPAQLGEIIDHSAPTADAILQRLLNKVAPPSDNGSLPDDMAAVVIRRKS